MKEKRRASTRKKALTVLVSLLAVVFVLLLAATVYVEWVLGKFYYNPSDMETLSSEEIEQLLQENQGTLDPNATIIDGEDVELGEVNLIESGDHILNILLVGQDRRPGEVRARSDVMILVTVNTQKKSVTMISFLRDLYVKIPGYMSNRINIPYAVGGIDLLYETMELNFGIRPDYFVEVDFNGFRELVDLVGGVDMALTEQEAKHLNLNEDFYDFPEESWKLTEGVNHLNGKQALAYARIRKIDPTGDFARTERQRKVISALMEKASSMNLLELNDLLLKMTDFISTDMTSREILSYAATLYPVLTNLKEVNSIHLPAENYYYSANIQNIGYVLVPNLEKNSAVIAKYQD